MARIPPPPSHITGPLGTYLETVWRALYDTPTLSYFSGSSPNSVLTGVGGDLAVNIGSASTDSRLWIKGGDVRNPSNTGWVVVRVA